MKIKKITQIVTLVLIPVIILAILIFDVYAIAEGGTEASISALIINLSYKFPLLTFMIGFLSGLLCGHLFWRMKSNQMTKSANWHLASTK